MCRHYRSIAVVDGHQLQFHVLVSKIVRAASSWDAGVSGFALNDLDHIAKPAGNWLRICSVTPAMALMTLSIGNGWLEIVIILRAVESTSLVAVV
jgi:hypothetical protein